MISLSLLPSLDLRCLNLNLNRVRAWVVWNLTSWPPLPLPLPLSSAGVSPDCLSTKDLYTWTLASGQALGSVYLFLFLAPSNRWETLGNTCRGAVKIPSMKFNPFWMAEGQITRSFSGLFLAKGPPLPGVMVHFTGHVTRPQGSTTSFCVCLWCFWRLPLKQEDWEK